MNVGTYAFSDSLDGAAVNTMVWAIKIENPQLAIPVAYKVRSGWPYLLNS